MAAENLAENTGHIYQPVRVDAIVIEGSRIRLGSSDDIERIKEIPENDQTDEKSSEKEYGAAIQNTRQESSQMIPDERETMARDKERQRSGRQPGALPNELACLQVEPDRDKCALPICCNNIRVFCVFVSAVFLLHGALSNYTLGILPDIGKRYIIDQLEQEFITGVEKIGFIITLLFVAFFGNRMNKVYAISSGSFLTAVGSVIMSTPYFVYGLRPGDNPSGISDYARAGLCQDFWGNSSTTQCELFTLDENKTGPFSLFCIAQFIIGIGAALYASMGLVYLEDNSKSKESPLMIGT